ncbi:hypothetical protein COV20_04065 [Candidatus Woesearchaeota archaeon CG10_big_fil_rev_8_21_14_0_10_45_16]|nr:MAG: hypothetical protein COV20_04065 [Candidatus Woesearchaeota archaeon CG10_big_fil_rev_8_21_14_0_10_45_16]
MKVSIVVIFDRFRESKIRRLLNSMKGQVNPDTEIIFIHEAVEPLPLPQLPLPIKYYNVPPKRGIPFNRNQGIKRAMGDIIVFIDDDCWVHERWLSSLIKPLEEDLSLLAVTSGTRIPKSNLIGDCISALGFPGGGSIGFSKMWKVSKSGFTNHLAAGNCALRKSLFEKVGFFDESMKSGAEDAELSWRIEKSHIPIKYVPEGYAFHEARTTFSSFVKWQLRRGKANYQFKKKVGKVGGLIRLRFWSAKNILKANITNWRLPLIIFFLGMSFILQQIGFIQEKNRVS